MRDAIRDKDNDIKNSCFICQKTKNDCINDFENFEEHCQKHNKWKYIMYISNIFQKDEKCSLFFGKKLSFIHQNTLHVFVFFGDFVV